MSDLDTLLNQIQESMTMAGSLIQAPDDNYALCLQSLTAARDALVAGIDRSTECKCQCHTNPDWHTLPCGCYSGNPVLE